MPTLRQRLTRPETYLLIVGLLMLAIVLDGTRAAEHQVSGRVYLVIVDVYQSRVSPGLSAYVECRYLPTCSEYSRQAVQRHGLFRGLMLSASRLWSCQSSVPLGTSDPVPTS